MLASVAGMSSLRTHIVVLSRGFAPCKMVEQDLCGQWCCLLTEFSLGLPSSLWSKAYCLDCTAFCVFPLSLVSYLHELILCIHPLSQSVTLLEGVTTINGSVCIPGSSLPSPSLSYLSFPIPPLLPVLSIFCQIFA